MNPSLRLMVVQKIYEKTTSSNKDISFQKHPYQRLIKKIFYGYFEKENELEAFLEKCLNKEKVNIHNLELLLKIILKASIYELIFIKKTPFKVVIDEYLEVTGKYFDKNQKKLVNAILDAVYKSQQ